MRWVFLAMLLAPPWVAVTEACELPSTGTRLESDRFRAALRTSPDPVLVGRHFTLELAVCPKRADIATESVLVDAHMPEHRHGMNYFAKVTAAPGGGYRVEGLMFHMPGRWEVVVEVRSGGKIDRLVRSLMIE